MKIRRRNKANPEFSLAAMTDVILLLLIFFMITSSVANQSAIDVKLPKGEAAPSVPNLLSVSILPDGSYFIDDKKIEKENLENAIVDRMKNVKNQSFTIRADKNALHQDVVFVMEIAEKYKYNIAIATVR
ncbi:MAG: biopolymer transporter ExbD [Flavobacteriaceae bacterium]|jgi:biopolymer transport protein ExbD|nr:biopolymer transporter ExbD [Flavobacteriaceae bacterium]